MVAVAARGDAPYVDVGAAGRAGLEGDAGRQLGVIVEVGDVGFFQPPRAQRLDADRHVLEILLALGRGDDDLVALRGLLVGRVGGAAGGAAARRGAGRRRRRVLLREGRAGED